MRRSPLGPKGHGRPQGLGALGGVLLNPGLKVTQKLVTAGQAVDSREEREACEGKEKPGCEMLSPEENPRDLGTQRLGSRSRKGQDVLLPLVSSGLTLRCPHLCQDVFKAWGRISREAAPTLVAAFFLESCANVWLDSVSWCSRPWGSPPRCPGCPGSRCFSCGAWGAIQLSQWVCGWLSTDGVETTRAQRHCRLGPCEVFAPPN